MEAKEPRDAASREKPRVSRSRRSVAKVVLALAVLTFLVVSLSPSEPKRFGLSLSQCLNLLPLDDGQNTATLPMDSKAKRALGAMGRDAMPHLLSVLTPSSPLKQRIDKALRNSPLKSPPSHRSVFDSAMKSDLRRKAAGVAFHHLGGNANTALEDLMSILEENRGTTSRENSTCVTGAAIALAAIEPEGVDALAAHAEGTDTILRRAAMIGLGYARCPDDRHVTTLLSHTSDKDSLTRMLAIQSLGRAKRQPRRVVPALIGALKDSTMMAPVLAARSLGTLGEDASAALPELWRLSNSTNIMFSAEARSAIRKIEGEEAASK